MYVGELRSVDDWVASCGCVVRQVVKVSVYIDDLNDNTPRFTDPLASGVRGHGSRSEIKVRVFTDPLVTLALSESASVASAYVIPAV